MTEERKRINVGIPVQWMVDPENPEKALGVVYEFSETGERKTVWYTPGGKPARNAKIITRAERDDPGKD